VKRVLDAEAPGERLAAFRIVAGVFVVGYLVLRLPVFLALGDRPAADFEAVGVLAPLSSPPSRAVLVACIVAAVASGIASTLGWRYRPAAVTFAASMLLLTTLRGSWGQLLHFENLMVLQLVVLAASPAADVWSLDAKRRAPTAPTALPGSSVRYGWPLAVASLVTTITYVIAGVAKLRYGGLDWISGDTLRNHIAYSAARLDVLGGNPPVFARTAVRAEWILGIAAVGAVVIELSAPVIFVGTRLRNAWVAAAWLGHVGILLTMGVGFPSALFGVAYAPFFALERVRTRGQTRGVARTFC
jgi:HTTM domain